LWEIAEQQTPHTRIVDYTQAIMDLGATVCRRSKPLCAQCPFASQCIAQHDGTQSALPARKPKKTMPVRATHMLIIMNDEDRILLQQRPPAGIWGGLWSFPECDTHTDVTTWCEQQLQLKATQHETLPGLRHTFSHFHLDITPVLVRAQPVGIMDSDQYIWYNTREPIACGLPAPVKTLIDTVRSKT
jgi:A/G-specific adenine glycosylase